MSSDANLEQGTRKVVRAARISRIYSEQPQSDTPHIGKYAGCVLKYKETPESAEVPFGFVVSAVNIPRWASANLPLVIQHIQVDELNEKYAPEWFERVIYLPVSESDNINPEVMDFVNSLITLGWDMDSLLARGCAQVTPLSPVFPLDFSRGSAGLGEKTGDYYTMVSKVDGTDEAIATEITIADFSKRQQFEQAKEHIEAYDRSQRLCTGWSNSNSAPKPPELRKIRATQEATRSAIRNNDLAPPF